MDLEDTESAVSNNSLTAALECDLAAHVVSEAHGTQCAVVGEDLPRSSRRLRLIRNEDADPQVRVAQALIENLVHRVGPVAPGTALPWAKVVSNERAIDVVSSKRWSSATGSPLVDGMCVFHCRACLFPRRRVFSQRSCQNWIQLFAGCHAIMGNFEPGGSVTVVETPRIPSNPPREPFIRQSTGIHLECRSQGRCLEAVYVLIRSTGAGEAMSVFPQWSHARRSG